MHLKLPHWFPLLPACCLILLAVCTDACTDATSRSSTPGLALPPALRNPYLRALTEEYDRFFADSMTGSQTPGAAVVIVQDSSIIFERGYGLKSNGTQDSVDIHTVFRIGSLSKGFAGVLTGLLVEEGKLHWEDPIMQFVPGFALSSAEQAGQVQLAHLLSHTTGLPYHAYTNMIEAGYDLRSIAPMFARLPLNGKAGEVFSYQNAAFSLIGEAMQAATGKGYPELLAEKIFQPAGMVDASADWASIHRCADKALPHNPTGAGWRPDTISTRFFNAAPAGGVNASISDMGQWLRLLLGYRPGIVSGNTLEKVFRPVIKTHNERRYFNQWTGPKEAYYAMGWRVLVNGADTLLYHGGSVNGFRGEIALDRKNGSAICTLFNAATPLANTCIPAFFDRYRAALPAIQQWQSKSGKTTR